MSLGNSVDHDLFIGEKLFPTYLENKLFSLSLATLRNWELRIFKQSHSFYRCIQKHCLYVGTVFHNGFTRQCWGEVPVDRPHVPWEFILFYPFLVSIWDWEKSSSMLTKIILDLACGFITIYHTGTLCCCQELCKGQGSVAGAGFTFVARASSRARQHLCVWGLLSHQKCLMKGWICGHFVQKNILVFNFHVKLDFSVSSENCFLWHVQVLVL